MIRDFKFLSEMTDKEKQGLSRDDLDKIYRKTADYYRMECTEANMPRCNSYATRPEGPRQQRLFT